MKLIFFKIICFLYIEGIVTKEKYRDQFKNDCGQPKNIGRIVGGIDAALGEFPWFTRIGMRLPFKIRPIFFCGGALITDRHILTAEHCFYEIVKQQQIKGLVASLGDQNDYGEKACTANYCSDRPVIYKVAKLIPYNLDQTTFKHDIALLRLATKVEFSRWISPICLPDNISPTRLIGQTAIAIGFGLINSRNQTLASILQKITIPILPNESCDMFAEPPEHGQICAGSPNKDSCDGDSGGPLFKLIRNSIGPRYMQLGIVSFGSKECENFSPAVYTDVNYYLEWIDSHLNKETSEY